jgi:general secretion pathway protein F
MDADSAKSARGRLRAQSLMSMLMEAVSGAAGEGRSLHINLSGGRVFNPTTLAVWTRQVAGLVDG